MSGGAEGSKSTGAGPSQDVYDLLGGMAQRFEQGTASLRGDYIGMLEAALKGETSGGMVPIVSKAVESSKQAGSRTLQATTEEMARTGLAGTPFGTSILSQVRQESEQAGAKAETDILQALIAQIPNFLLGTGQTLGSLAPGSGQRESKNLSSWGSYGGTGGR